MRVTAHAGAGDFLAVAQPALEENEAANNLMLGVCLRLQQHPERIKHPPLLATVGDEAGLILAAMMTPPHKLVLYAARSDFTEALDALAHHLIASAWTPPGVHAAPDLAEAFAQCWARHVNVSFVRRTRERIYELRQVIPPSPASGALRLATTADAALVTQWARAFTAEALPDETLSLEDARELIDIRLTDRTLYVWDDDGQVVSMAGVSRPTRHGITIGLVYTPPAFRKRGYASACVAALSQRMLDAGFAFCTLYTDLSNPTSNRIYQAIGYRLVCDIHEILFSATE